MPKITASNSMRNALLHIDRICDYIPLASTITNLIDIFEKGAFKGFLNAKTINRNRYYSHVNNKSLLRCVTLLIPILGNIIIGIHDLIHKHRAKVRKEMILKAEQRIVQDMEMQIVEMRKTVEEFRKIINDPQESIELNYQLTHQEKINYSWSSIKTLFFIQSLSNCALALTKQDQNQLVKEKQQQISALTNELSQLRQMSYRDYIKTLDSTELLKEALKYYPQNLSVKSEETKDSAMRTDLETILPKLKEKVLAQTNQDHRNIEIREIILQIENS